MIPKQIAPAWIRCGAYLMIAFPLLYLAFLVSRTDSLLLLSAYAIPFFAYFLLLSKRQTIPMREIIIVGLAIRAILLFSSPQLSDDSFRFIWDGSVQAIGVNPYVYTPDELVHIGLPPGSPLSTDQSIYQGLNSKEYFSIYPPAAQLLFRLAAAIAQGNASAFILFLKLCMFLAECLTIYLLPRLLSLFNKDPLLSIWYVLNPLVLMELGANIHLEAPMIAISLLSVFIFHKYGSIWAGLVLGLALSFKFTPLMVLPLLIVPLGWRTASKLFISAALVFLAGFALYFDPIIVSNLGNSMGLYFHTFEFNGSIFYLYRMAGPAADTLHFLFKICLPVITIGLIIWFSIKSSREKLTGLMLLALTSYLLLSGNVHPWYLTALIPVSIFAGYRFVLIWTSLIIFTYITYQTSAYVENYWVLLVEYVAVYYFLWKEVSTKRPLAH